MCGRYSFVPSSHQIETYLRDIYLPEEITFSPHIAPTEYAWVVTSEQPYALQAMQWGLVPAWSKEFRPSGRTINARMETMFEKPSFREAARYRHCLVPADSFYEWRRQLQGQHIPYRIMPADGSLLFMAGIWEEWRRAGEAHRTFAIITVPASRQLTELHDRMPALLLTEEARSAWLRGDLSDNAWLQLLSHTLSDTYLTWYRISDRLNKPSFKDPILHEPV